MHQFQFLPVLLLLLLLFLLPTSPAHATTIPELRTLRRVQRRLAVATAAAACKTRRKAAIARVQARIDLARRCHRARKRHCAPLRPFLKRLQQLRQRQCRAAPKQSVGQLRAALAAAGEKAREALGLPRPAYKTLTLEPVGAVANSVLIALHGFGGTAASFLAQAEQIGATGQLRGARFVFVQAPAVYSLASGVRVPSWFENEDREQVVSAANNIDALAEIQRRVYGIRAKRVFLFGVSQGGALALTVYLRHKVGAAFIFSGFLPIAETYPEEMTTDSADAPAVMVHGAKDSVVPVQFARQTRDLLVALQRPVRYIEFASEGHRLVGVQGQVFSEAFRLFRGVMQSKS